MTDRFAIEEYRRLIGPLSLRASGPQR